jgi:hypothetical protein
MSDPVTDPSPTDPAASAEPVPAAAPPDQPPLPPAPAQRKGNAAGIWLGIGASIAAILIVLGGLATLIALTRPSGVVTAQPGPSIDEPHAEVVPEEQVTPSPSPSPDEVGGPRQAKLGLESITQPTGMTVAASAKTFNPASDASNLTPGHAAVQVTIKITNDEPVPINTILFSIVVRSGPDQVEAERMFVSNLGQEISGVIPGGRPATGVYGYSIPKNHLDDITVILDGGLTQSIFTGSAGKS